MLLQHLVRCYSDTIVDIIGQGQGKTCRVRFPKGIVYKEKYNEIVIKIPYLSAEEENLSEEKKNDFYDMQEIAIIEEATRLLTIPPHDNVVKCIGYDKYGGRMGYIMESLDGINLARFLNNCESYRIPIKKALSFIKQVGEGLKAIHGVKVIHKDIKPANLMVIDKEKIVIIDFGIAKSIRAGTITPWYTLGYAPPEQIKNSPDLGITVDIYATGIVLFEMINGYCPFDWHQEERIVEDQKKMIMKPFKDDVPNILRMIILKAIQPDPKDRWQNVDDFLNAIIKYEEYEEGITLDKYLEDAKKFPKHIMPIKRALGLINQICEKLKPFHESNIIHKNIKPSNIMVVNEQEIFIMDFGFSKDIRIGESFLMKDKGKYSAPEQILGNTELDFSADIHAIGLILYELVNGCLPFSIEILDSDSESEIASKLKKAYEEADIVFQNNIHENLKQIILKAIKFEPKDRWQNVNELLNQIVEFQKIYDEEVKTACHKINELISSGKMDEAKDLFKSTELEDCPEIILAKARLMIHEIIQLYVNETGKYHDNGDLHYYIALLYQSLDNFESADRHYNLAKDKCKSDINERLCDQISKHIKKVLKDTEQARVKKYLDDGLAYYRDGNFSEAIATFTSGLDILPYGKLYYRRGLAYIQKEDYINAKKDFEDAEKYADHLDENDKRAINLLKNSCEMRLKGK